jgi:hypothetical protein
LKKLQEITRKQRDQKNKKGRKIKEKKNARGLEERFHGL